MKPIPILYENKADCCGCTACYAICPKSAISMIEDEEGFEYPQINEEICVRCGMCMKVCPIKEAKCNGISNVSNLPIFAHKSTKKAAEASSWAGMRKMV